MKRIRILGVTLAAVLSMTALADATSAVPTKLYSEATDWTGATELKGTPTTDMIRIDLPTAGTLGCENAGFETAVGKVAAEFWTGESLKYGPCQGIWKTNGCQQVFHFGAETGPGTFEGTFDLSCPEGKNLEIENYWSSCDATVYPKSGLKATYTNVGSGSSRSVEVKLQGGGVKYTITPICGSSGESATIAGTWQVKGYVEGKQVGERLEPADGFFIAKNGGESTATFNGETYPLTVNASQSPSPNDHRLTMPGKGTGTFSCESVFMNATLATPTPEFTDTLSMSNCTGLGIKATVEMNSCTYVFDITNTEAPFVGTQKLVCSKEGDAMVIKVGTTCTEVFPPQTLATVKYENLGADGGRYVLAKAEGTGIKYTHIRHNFLCPVGEGVHENAEFKGNTVLQGQP